METIKTQISNAIERSKANDKIVAITIDGDSGDALSVIKSLTTDCRYAMNDREGTDFLDVWSRVWRLNIYFVQN